MPDLPTLNLVRSLIAPQAIGLRAKADDPSGLGTLAGHFSVFDQWTEIHSWYEGDFLERIAPGAFARTIAERGDNVKVLYDHGYDPSVGNKPLGTITSIGEDKRGAFYEVELLDTSYNRDLAPALRAGLLGSSFRFSVVAEELNAKPGRSKHNPDGLPERSILDVDLYEFGPVTFPAYEGAEAGMRSGTDAFLDRMMSDPGFVARFTERCGIRVAEQIIDTLPPDGRSERASNTPGVAADGFTNRAHRQQFARRTVAWHVTK